MAKASQNAVIVEVRADTKQAEKDLDIFKQKLQKRKDDLLLKMQEEHGANGERISYDESKLTAEERKELEEINRQLDEIGQKEYERLRQEEEITKEKQAQTQETKKTAEEEGTQLDKAAQLRLEIKQALDDLKLMEGAKILNNQDLVDIENVKNDIRQMAIEYKKLTGEKLHIKGITDLNNTLPQINSQIKSVGSSITDVIKKVSRWAFAIFGIRSMYMFLRQEMSALSGYNEQIGADVEYIRFALATALQPVIETIIELAYKLLTYIAYIAKAWFGVNIFANATAKAFEKTNKSMGKTAKTAKELQRTLAGFDEMNILQKNGGTATGGGGGGVSLPTMDLSDWKSVEIPDWIKWIAQNKDLVLGFFRDLAIAIATFKFASFIAGLTGVFDALAGLTGVAKWLAASGIIITLLGIYQTISGIVAFIINPNWSNFLTILGGIALTLEGIGITLLAINSSNPLGWILTAAGMVGILITSILDLINSLFNETKQTNTLEEAERKLDETRKKLKETTDAYVNAVDYAEEAEKNLEEVQKKHKISAEDLLTQMEKEHKTYKDLDEKQREVYKAYIKNKNAQEDLETQTSNYNNALHDEANNVAQVGLATAKASGNYDEFKKSVMDAYDQGKLSALEAGAWIQEAMWDMDDASRIAFVQDVPNNIMYALSTATYSKKWKEFKQWWDDNLESLNSEVYIQVKTTATESKNSKSSYKSSSKPYAKGGIYIPPKLAIGGVINQPGRGIPLGSAIGGERGAEGVIPLTDSQQMELLGEAIGRYITVSLTNITELDGRTIARKVDKVRQNDNFVLNR